MWQLARVSEPCLNKTDLVKTEPNLTKINSLSLWYFGHSLYQMHSLKLKRDHLISKDAGIYSPICCPSRGGTLLLILDLLLVKKNAFLNAYFALRFFSETNNLETWHFHFYFNLIVIQFMLKNTCTSRFIYKYCFARW